MYGRLYRGIQNFRFQITPKRDFFTIINQYQKGVTLTLGKLTGLKEPGIRLNIPLFQHTYKVDMRWHFENLDGQEIIARDNISLKLDAVMSSRIVNEKFSICNISNLNSSVKSLACGKIREIISQHDFNDILHHRELISEQIKNEIQKSGIDNWGVEVGSIIIKDILFDPVMVRAMAKKAEAIRDRESKIISSQTEVEISKKYLEASKVLSQNSTAFQLRQLDTLLNMSREKGNMIIVVPSDLTTTTRDSFKINSYGVY